MGYTYKDAGVDVEAGYEAVRLMKRHAHSTFDSHVLQDLGSFGGMYEYGDNVLVSGTDGVGTKLKYAFVLDKHDTVGIDCVAMCANDVVCAGAAPLFFLDYIAVGKNLPERVADIVRGVAEGCLQAGCCQPPHRVRKAARPVGHRQPDAVARGVRRDPRRVAAGALLVGAP